MECNFSYRHYIETLKLFSEKYSFTTLGKYNQIDHENNLILLRHDIDFSLDYALRLAKIEKKNDFLSTYFILLHSPYYNALSPKNSKIIAKISDMGHEIGLHYDTTLMPKNKEKIISQLKSEADLLFNITGKKIKSVAQHNTSITNSITEFIPKSLFIDPMSKEILKNMLYLSDSVQNWRRGCMCKHIEKNTNIQILTHPFWWNETPMTKEKLFNTLQQLENKKMNDIIDNHIILYKYYFERILKNEKSIKN